MNILILGKGFIGNYLYQYLNSVPEPKQINILYRADCDYTDKESLRKYILNHFQNTYDQLVVINCSGYTGKPNVDACESNKEECFQLNAVNPVTIQNICKSISSTIRFIHISSGCIYNGYGKEYTEYSKPNFGIWNTESSYYSKTKHLAEIYLDKEFTAILRIRMPFCSDAVDRNLLIKLLNYNNLISQENSLTCVEDLVEFIYKFIPKFQPGIYNIVNSGSSINAEQIITAMGTTYHMKNLKWSIKREVELGLVAKRSNCVLSTEKITSMGLALPDVRVSLAKCMKKLSTKCLKF